MAAEDYVDFDDCFEEAAGRHYSRHFRRVPPGMPGMPRNHGTSWEESDDLLLTNLWDNRAPLKEIAEKLGRTQVAIRARLMAKYQINPDGPRAQVANSAVALHSQQPSDQLLNAKEPMMQNYQHVLALLQKGYTTVSVCFDGSRQGYTYKIPNKMAEGLEKGDMLVVPARNEFKLVTVAEVHKTPQIDVKQPLALKWVVQRVDFTAYNDQTDREAEAIEKLQNAERAEAQRKAIETLLGSVENRDEILKLIEVL